MQLGEIVSWLGECESEKWSSLSPSPLYVLKARNFHVPRPSRPLHRLVGVRGEEFISSRGDLCRRGVSGERCRGHLVVETACCRGKRSGAISGTD